MSDGSDSIFHRPIQRPAAIPETLPPSVQSPREILALCFSTFHNSACPQYTLSPIMSIVESKRCADGRVVQRQVLYLGEINDSQHEAWCRVVEVVDEDTRRRTQLALFPVERGLPDYAKAYSVQV